MRDADRTPDRASAGAPIPPRSEGEPHLTFETLLEDSLQEIINHEAAEAAEMNQPDRVTTLCDDAVAVLRSAGSGLPASPFHHAYLTPAGSPALPSRPAKLDVRY